MPEDCISNVDGPSFRLRELAEVSSTNDVVKRALEAGEPEGLAVRACRQTGGYGRQGRTWTSPEGGLYLSLLLRPRVPSAQLPTLSLVAGLAVRFVLRHEGCRVDSCQMAQRRRRAPELQGRALRPQNRRFQTFSRDV